MIQPDFSPWKLNHCKLSFYLPIRGEQHVLTINCASFRFLYNGLTPTSEEPCLMVNFDWEDEKRSGAPKALSQAELEFEFNDTCGLKMQKFSSNGIIITGFEGMNLHIDTPSPNPMI